MAFYSGDLPHAMLGGGDARSGTGQWTSGSGLRLHSGDDMRTIEDLGWYLDPDRSWKTGWQWQMGTGDMQQAHRWGITSGYQGWDGGRDRWGIHDPAALGRAPYTTGNWQKGQWASTSMNPRTAGPGGMALEVLDWGAYDKDPLYKSWLDKVNKDQFGTLQDILDAEEWMARGGAEGDASRELAGDLEGLRGELGDLRSDWQASIFDPSGLERMISQLTTRLGDLESRNWSTGDIGSLDDQLDAILGEQRSGDQALSDLIGTYRGEVEGQLTGLQDRYDTLAGQSASGDEELIDMIGDFEQRQFNQDRTYRDEFLTKSGYEESMANRLSELQKVMRDEWGQDIQRLDLGSVREAIESGQGDLNAIAQQLAGLQSGVTAGQTGLQNVITDLSGLRATGETSLAELRSQLTAKETALQEALAAQAGTLRAEGAAGLAGLRAEGQATEEALRERLATGERALTAEGQAREARLAAAGQAREERLSAADIALGQRLSSEGQAREARLTAAGEARGQALTERIAGLEARGEDEIANLRTDLRDYYDRARAETTDELGLLEARLVSDYGDKLLSLDRTHQAGLGDVRGELREAVSGLSGQLGQARGDVSQQIGNLYKQLSDQRTEFEAGIGDFERRQFENLNKEALARTTGLTDLSGKLQIGLAGEAAERTKGLTEVRSDLSSALSAESAERRKGLQQISQAGMLGLQAEAAERHKGLLQEAGTRTKEIAGLRGELTGALGDIEQRGAQAISDVYQSRAKQIADLESEWGRDLQTQEQTLSKRVKSGEDALNKRLSELSQTMNYRMLGDSALGIKSRRSKAYKSGRASTGTGQLSRGTKISTLNI